MELCDVHNHLLPGVDDGCRSLVETLLHLRAFRAQGVTELVFTPHLLAAHLDARSVDEVLALQRLRFDDVVAAFGDDPTVPRLHLGQEILAPQPADLDVVLDRPDVGLGGGDALLVELGFTPGFDGEGVVERVRSSGRRVVLAHPERYRYGTLDPIDAMRRWRDRGALLQLNGGSLGGLYTESAQRLARAMLEERLVDVVASDHHGDDRPHSTESTVWAIEEAGFADSVEQLLGRAPSGLIDAESRARP
jgi:tyrosine-protein phosphatase YwqE